MGSAIERKHFLYWICAESGSAIQFGYSTNNSGKQKIRLQFYINKVVLSCKLFIARLLQSIFAARFFVVILVLISTQASVSAQNLIEMLDLSRQNYPSLKAKQAEINSSDKKIGANKTDYLPTLILQDQYTLSSNNNMTGSFYPNEGIGISTTGAALPTDNYNGVYGSFASIVMDWKVFSFGKVRAGVNAARSVKTISQADFENEIFQHQIRVTDIYLSLLLNRKLVMAQENNLKRAVHLRDVVKAGALSGMRPGVDSMLANVEFAKASMQLSEIKRNEKALKLRLAELTAVSDLEMKIDSLAFYKMPKTDTTGPGQYIHPRLKLFQSQADGSFARSKAVKLAYMPSFSLVASGMARGSGNSRTTGVPSYDLATGSSYSLYNYLVGVSFRWNITNLARLNYDYKSEKFQAEKFQYLYEEQALALKRQSGDAQAQMDLALEQAQLAPLQLEAAKSAYIQAEARYSNGLWDVVSLNQSYYLLNRAETDYYIAVNNVWKAFLIKSAAAGDLSLFLNQVK